MGIAIHNLSAAGETAGADASVDLTAAVRQAASGILGTTVQLADLVRDTLTRFSHCCSISTDPLSSRAFLSVSCERAMDDFAHCYLPSANAGHSIRGRRIHVYRCGGGVTDVSARHVNACFTTCLIAGKPGFADCSQKAKAASRRCARYETQNGLGGAYDDTDVARPVLVRGDGVRGVVHVLCGVRVHAGLWYGLTS